MALHPTTVVGIDCRLHLVVSDRFQLDPLDSRSLNEILQSSFQTG